MRLGFWTDVTDEWIGFAGQAGVPVVGALGQARCRLDLDEVTDEALKPLADSLARHRVALASLRVPGNPLDPDARARQAVHHRLTRAVQIASRLGATRVSVGVGGDPSLTVDQNLSQYKRVFTPLAKLCREHKLRLALETSPHVHGYPIRIGNIAFSPEAVGKLFDAVPDEAIGLAFDPSPFQWLGSDPAEVVREFSERICVVHARDTEVLEDVLHRVTVFGAGWWRYRLPGWGEIDWTAVFRALLETGFDGDVLIEPDDPVFAGPRLGDGLKLGLKFLRRFMPD